MFCEHHSTWTGEPWEFWYLKGKKGKYLRSTIYDLRLESIVNRPIQNSKFPSYFVPRTSYFTSFFVPRTSYFTSSLALRTLLPPRPSYFLCAPCVFARNIVWFSRRDAEHAEIYNCKSAIQIKSYFVNRKFSSNFVPRPSYLVLYFVPRPSFLVLLISFDTPSIVNRAIPNRKFLCA